MYQNSNDSMLDGRSLGLSSLTICLGIIQHLTSSDIVTFFTVGAGATAMIYNILKIANIFKKKV